MISLESARYDLINTEGKLILKFQDPLPLDGFATYFSESISDYSSRQNPPIDIILHTSSPLPHLRVVNVTYDLQKRNTFSYTLSPDNHESKQFLVRAPNVKLDQFYLDYLVKYFGFQVGLELDLEHLSESLKQQDFKLNNYR